MSSDIDEFYYEATAQQIADFPYPARAWVTLGHRKWVSEEEIKTNFKRLLMRLRKYSGGHMSAYFRGFWNKGGSDLHLIIFAEKGIKPGFVKERWTHGKVVPQSERVFAKGDDYEVRNTAFYAMRKHPDDFWFLHFCPNPRKCSSDFCPRRVK